MQLEEIGAFLLVLVAVLIFGNLWFQFVEAILSRIKKLFTRRRPYRSGHGPCGSDGIRRDKNARQHRSRPRSA